MKTLSLHLLMLGAALAGACSKSSASADKAKQGSAAAAVDPNAPTPCDEACTQVAICYEQFFDGESFKDGDGCVEECTKMTATERTEWIAEVNDARRTKQCGLLFEEAGMANGDEELATLVEGEAQLGCFAWSAQLRAVACVVGNRGSAGTHVQLAFAGGGKLATIPLVASELGGATKIDAKHAEVASAFLAQQGFSPLTAAATALQIRKPAGFHGAAVRLTKIEREPGGNNVAPTYSHMIVAACNGRTTELFSAVGEGLAATANARALDDPSYVLVEVSLHTGREGEFDDGMEAVLLDAASCKVVGRAK